MPAIGARPWTPREIATTAWYDAADETTITEAGGLVSQINDKGTVGTRHLLQATVVNRPSTGTRTLNGLNVLDHDGARLMRTASFAWPTSGNAAVFAVAVVDAIDNSTDAIFGTSDDDGVGLKEFDLRADNASVFNGKVFATNLGGDVALTGGPFPGPAVYNANFDFTGGILNAYVNGTKRTADSTYSSKFQANGTFNAFAKANNAAQRPDGAWGEIIITEDVTLVTRQKIEGYLAWKWGLVANLPNNHPYRFRPPTATSQDNRPDWTPASIPTTTWYDMADYDTITESGGAVSQVDDKSGNGNHLTQAPGNAQPTTGVATINGLNALYFDGGDYLEKTSVALPASGDYTVFCVSDPTTPMADNGQEAMWSLAEGPDYIYIVPNSTTDWVGQTKMVNTGTDRVWINGPYNGPSIYELALNFTGAIHKAYVDSRFVYTANQAYTKKLTTATLNMMRSPPGRKTIGSVGELIIVPDVTDTTRQKVEGYLAHKWGLTGNLPSDHPYKTTKPKAERLWTPGEVATAAWYDAADVSTITEALGFVSQWDDKSGNGNHATQGTPLNQPTTGIATLNGLNVLGYSHVNDSKMTISTLTLTAEHSIFKVIKFGVETGTYFDWLRASDGSETIAIGGFQSARNFFSFYGNGSSWDSIGANTPNIGCLVPRLCGVVGYIGGATPYVDGTAQDTRVSSMPSKTGFVIGSSQSSNAPEGDIGELIIIDRTINTTERQKIEGYLAWKWGINHQLPATHPYRARPPYA